MPRPDIPSNIDDPNLHYLEDFVTDQGDVSEAPSTPEEQKFKYIGNYTKRIDAEKIVTGNARYTHDIKLRGMLHGKILRCPHACAEVLSVDLSAAEQMPGVFAALQLKTGVAKYAGEQVAAVAATTEGIAEAALKAIKVDYTVLPHAVTVQKAMTEGSPQVHDRPNISLFEEYSRGDVEAGFSAADVVVEHTYQTAVEIHNPTETHGSIAAWEGNRLTVYDSTQAIFGVRDGLARALRIPASRIKVIKKYMGGGFGSKLGLNDYTVVAARLARKAGRPVKILLTRKDNNLCVGNRPSSLQTVKVGAKKDGTLTALFLKNYTCGGIAGGDRCSEPLIDIYKCENAKVEEYSVYTHTGAQRPTRAPGFPQGVFALDGVLTELSGELGMDPLFLRRKNYSIKNRGDTGIPYSSKGLDKCYEIGAGEIGWQRRNSTPGAGNGKLRRGLGMASQIWWGVGRVGTAASVKFHRDGSIDAICGTQDLGTGTRTYMATITADTLGVKPEDITVKIGDTEYPWCGSSGGSTTTPSVAPAIRDAALKAIEYLKEQAARTLEIDKDKVAVGYKIFYDSEDETNSVELARLLRRLPQEKTFHGEYTGRPSEYAYNSFGAHFAEVEVNTETGQIKVIKVVAVHEIGRVMNKLTAESQVIGGVTQGISAALFEQRIMDETTGTMVNPNMRDYKIATSMDIPEIVPLFIDSVDPHINNLGTKGLGEPPRIPISAAIANAVYNAIGVHVREIPMTPDKVLSALKRKEAS